MANVLSFYVFLSYVIELKLYLLILEIYSVLVQVMSLSNYKFLCL
jgi:hypothetical protein